MITSASSALTHVAAAAHSGTNGLSGPSAGLRTDKVVFLIAIAVAVVVVLGFAAAFLLYCQNRGAWPALDMPSWQAGGTWKLYCRK